MINKLKVCLVGYGYWGPKLARNFQNSNYFKLISVSDKSKFNWDLSETDTSLKKFEFWKFLANFGPQYP